MYEIYVRSKEFNTSFKVIDMFDFLMIQDLKNVLFTTDYLR